MGVDDLLKYALNGDNAILLGMLGVIAFFCTRVVRVSDTWAYSLTAIAGGVVGAMTSFAQAFSAVGLEQVTLGRAGAVGFIVTGGGTLLVGATLHKLLDASGLWPVSAEKKHTEAIRDPLSTVQPGSPVPPEEKP